MSYIQVDYKGKAYGLKFNQMAIIIMAQKADQENYAATANYAMVWAGLKANAYRKSQELDLNFEEVCDWVDTMGAETLNAIAAVFEETEEYKKLLDTDDKKVVTDKKKLKSTTRKS